MKMATERRGRTLVAIVGTLVLFCNFGNINGFSQAPNFDAVKPLTLLGSKNLSHFAVRNDQPKASHTVTRRKLPHHRANYMQLSMTYGTPDLDDQEDQASTTTTDWGKFALFSGFGFLYWYLMVFAAAAQANGLPVPDFIPMTPGWPATEEDFVPVIEDSYHFFYLSELLHNDDAPYVIPPRLAIFNGVEAWIFAMLPALWQDTARRLPRSVLLISWLLLGINLTNAFLAPYLAVTELRSNGGVLEAPSNNSFVGVAFRCVFGAIAASVAGFALYQSIIVATSNDWSEFLSLVKTDRSYLAFCVDPILFSIFQPLILARVKYNLETIDYVPFVGLVAWLFDSNSDEKES